MTNGSEHSVVPFAALMPLRRPAWIWALYLRLVFLLRFTPGRFFPKVQRLSTVFAMRWVLVPPFARDDKAGRPVDRQHHLMFESNFGGEAFAYIENFARVLKPGMKLVFRPALGYPGLEDPAEFTRFALKFDVAPDLYYCAYPDAGPVRVQQALLRLRAGSIPDVSTEPEFLSPLPIPMRRKGQRASPQWATVVLRVKADRAAALRRHLANVRVAHEVAPDVPRHAGDDYPFRGVSRMHFGRFTVLDTPSGPYLMLTITFDALRRFRRRTAPIGRWMAFRFRHAEIALAEMVAENFEALDTILRHCHGYTSVDVPQSRREWSMLGYLLANQKDRGMGRQFPYCAYPRATVSEVTRALVWLASAERGGAGHAPARCE